MNPVSRRDFVRTAGVLAGAGLVAGSAAGAAAGVAVDPAALPVRLFGDGVGLTPRESAALLAELTRKTEVGEDSYLIGGEVEAFERRVAALLGKESAVLIPSGTLANHLALRALAGPARRILVPEMSHIYNDTGDACQTLSGLNLVPLAAGKATFTLAEVEAVLARTASGRVAAQVGAIAIESPVRRLAGQMFDWPEAQRICAFAREHGIGTHLDGARLFIASAYTGIAPAEYARPFDTVYVSLWKYFNAGVGAVLAGPRRLLEGMFHARRMFGGNLAVGWPAALLAGHHLDGFVERMRAAVAVSEDFYTRIAEHPRIAVERIANGSNVARLIVKDLDIADLTRRLATQQILLPAGVTAGALNLTVNETWNRRSGAELAAAFVRALD